MIPLITRSNKQYNVVKQIQWLTGFLVFNLFFSLVLCPFIVFWGPFDSLKTVAVGSVLTSRHPQFVRAFLTDAEIEQILSQNNQPEIVYDHVLLTHSINTDNGIIIEDIEGSTFKGKVMIIDDPLRVKVAVTNQIGVAGQRLSELVNQTHAIAGVNGGGFYDPDGKGNGAYPDGLTVQNGEIIHNNAGNKKVNLVGIDKQGKLIIGEMTAQEIKEHHIQEAVSFFPNLIVEGQPQITGDGGWGIAPRTGIGQRADGSIIFVVIDGRQPSWSMGATLRDLMNVFIQYGAVNAVNLDGGSSSEMIYHGQILNRLWNIFGERYIPSAFVVLP